MQATAGLKRQEQEEEVVEGKGMAGEAKRAATPAIAAAVLIRFPSLRLCERSSLSSFRLGVDKGECHEEQVRR